ncbi:MAG: methionine ABC transporter ATP-binding protein [Limnochordia bacterium]|nr:methionine ABC transporter ATP-binding protein [Bacillota bacterium]NLH30704.1 methionine ABC transporter ATP-binding protein [Bacillota bacterium]HOB09605.1 methionine ABC transporter ATP-binding protein [Limnochordia bacterium]HXK98405.1 methionine ABC transporter ATP-binding protein [Limnochordia bacterium]
MIELRNVSKTFITDHKIQALKDVNLHIPKGEIFGIIGQSGAGKSTLIRCVNGLEKPDTGEVIVDGVNMCKLNPVDLREARKRIGMIFQHFNLLASRTVAGNIAYPLEIAGVKRSAIKERVDELLHLVGLEDKANAYPRQLSGGQKQRVGIARALANRPQVLLCDEATSALDPETTKSVLHLLADINHKMGLTIVLITHEMAVIQEICDQVAVLDNGTIEEIGSVIEILARPRTDAAKRMVQGLISIQIPPELLERPKQSLTESCVLLKLKFIGSRVHEPVISGMLRKFSVEANILFGKIDQIKDIPFGVLLVEICGLPDQVEKAIAYMNEQGVETEVVTNG